jgi:dTDP-4-dehydrorhamnose 3,5-epimerase
MRFRPLPIDGAFVIDTEPVVDDRGSFARAFSVDEFVARGLDARVAQTSLSSNARAGTLRGMHYAAMPCREAKTIRCVRGRLFDVLVDVRRGSPTCGAWIAEELSSANARAVYAPPGVAHGFLTLEDGTDVLYQMSEPYDPSAARGFRHDDPRVGIVWPACPVVIAPRDAAYDPLEL